MPGETLIQLERSKVVLEPPYASPLKHSKQQFVASVVDLHGQQLIRFFVSRLRSDTDAKDLAQEVYLRLLRLERPDLIRRPEAYLFTVAANIVRESALRSSSRSVHMALQDISSEELAVEALAPVAIGPEETAEQASRMRLLEELLTQLSPKARAALIWHRRDGQTYKQIAARLGVSVNMVKKYLVQAVAYCRRAMTETGAMDE